MVFTATILDEFNFKNDGLNKKFMLFIAKRFHVNYIYYKSIFIKFLLGFARILNII